MLRITRFLSEGRRLGFKKYGLILVSLVLVLFDARAQSGAWTQKTSMPIQGGSACVLNGKIYVMGGSGAGFSDLATNEVYDPLTDTWTIRSPMPTPRGFLSTAAVNDTLYAIGGGFPESKSKVEAYDPVSNTWTVKADMLGPRLGAQAAVVDGIIYNIGGNYNHHNCEAYDPSTNTWTPKKPVPGSGGVLSATAYNGLIYTFGGSTYSPWAAVSNVYAYDPQSDTWTAKQGMPTPRFAFQTYLVDGKIYAIGGSQGENTVLSTVEAYNPVNDMWEAKPNMPDNLAWLSGAVVDNKIYVIGGSSDWESFKLTLWEYDPAFHTDIATGTVSGPWTLANSPYCINGEITVPNGETLTIEPGVQVVFMGHYKLNVQGRLLAVGTQKNSIQFTAQNTETGWHGIRFINTPITNDTSKLVYCSFKNGKANTGASNSLDRCGGAIMINGFDKVFVSNCLFEYNMTSGDVGSTGGPGVCIFYGSPTVTKCTFRNNTGTSAGAIKVDFTSEAVISNNVISNNTSYCGTIICAYGSDNRPTISGNVISNNVATGGGGGILVYSNSSPRIMNNLITHNQAPVGGGIYGLDNAKPVFINNTVVYNTATSNGGGICCESNSDPILVNNILYGNSATAGKQMYLTDALSDPIVAYCDIEGGMAGFAGLGAGASYDGLYEHNIDASPLFIDTASTDYRLSNYSWCIGAGIDSVEISGVWYHAPSLCFGGSPRPDPAGSKPDIGANENPLPSPLTGGGIPTVITIKAGVNNETDIIISPQMHAEYGVTYPLTYEFSIPQGISGLLAYKRHSKSVDWAQVLEKTSGDFFNADEVTRFEYASGKAFVSVGFANSSDTTYVKITDNFGRSVPVTFSRICKYYDDRDAVVSCSADDYADWNLVNFLKATENFRSKHLWLSIGANTGVCNQQSFDSLQVQLDRGYMEAGAHSRSHPGVPLAEPDSEITGCKMDLINYLDMPPLFRNGSHEYVYTWIALYGYDDQVIRSLLAQNHFLASRLYYIDESSTDFPDWDVQNGLYKPFGVTRELGPVMGGFLGTGDIMDLNNAFDKVVTRGGVYHLVCHPSILEWDKAYTWSHLNHISDRKNIWYVSLGHLFVYHFAQDNYLFTPTTVVDNEPTAPADFSLLQNYPNPFNPSTTIRYGLPHRANVSLVVYNTIGQQVATLVKGDQEAGYHEVKFDGSGFATGVYFYRLQAGDFVQTRKLMVLK